ncbi:MAG TPA: 3-dehydroquinate synthase [Bacillota bacterium]|nr:3-dehydroquinate synthase [Bacillota bacterium]
MTMFHVPLKRVVDDSYDIEIGWGLISQLISDLKHGLVHDSHKIAVITDSNVKPLYGDNLLAQLRSHGFIAEQFVFPAGEPYKTRETKAMLEDQLIEKAYGRDSCIIALGGGVVTDMAGFIAGTFGRGIPFINYATTVLAAADASIGGKTAVDTPAATNLIGVFHQPAKVYIDLSTWKTLTGREVRDGLAETIKHACMAEADFFTYLEEHIDQLLSAAGEVVLDPDVCEAIARKNCEIKYQVVREDEKERNLRQILNLGHTVGRAAETLSGYRLSHGEAVAIGLVAQARIGCKLGFISERNLARVVRLCQTAGLPTEIPGYIETSLLVDKMHTDKKVRNNQIRFVFQDEIGKVKRFEGGTYSLTLAKAFITETLEEFRE